MTRRVRLFASILLHPGFRSMEEHCTPPANWANTNLANERYKACVGNTDDRSTQKIEW